MSSDGLTELVKAALEYAENMVNQDERPPPLILARTKHDQVVHLPLHYTDPNSRSEQLQMSMLAFGFWEVVEYVIVFESWLVVRDYPREGIDLEKITQEISPSKESDRQDALIIAGASHTDTVMGYANVIAYDNSIAVSEFTWADSAEGFVDGGMLKMLPPASLPPPPENLLEEFYAAFPSLEIRKREQKPTQPKEN